MLPPMWLSKRKSAASLKLARSSPLTLLACLTRTPLAIPARAS